MAAEFQPRSAGVPPQCAAGDRTILERGRGMATPAFGERATLRRHATFLEASDRCGRAPLPPRRGRVPGLVEGKRAGSGNPGTARAGAAVRALLPAHDRG